MCTCFQYANSPTTNVLPPNYPLSLLVDHPPTVGGAVLLMKTQHLGNPFIRSKTVKPNSKSQILTNCCFKLFKMTDNTYKRGD